MPIQGQSHATANAANACRSIVTPAQPYRLLLSGPRLTAPRPAAFKKWDGCGCVPRCHMPMPYRVVSCCLASYCVVSCRVVLSLICHRLFFFLSLSLCVCACVCARACLFRMPAPPLPSLTPAIIAFLGCDCLDIEPIPRSHPTRNLNTNIRYTLFHVNSPINLILLRHARPVLVLGRPSSLSTSSSSRLLASDSPTPCPALPLCPAALPCRPALPCLHTMSHTCCCAASRDQGTTLSRRIHHSTPLWSRGAVG
jgi:hypothetical protein